MAFSTSLPGLFAKIELERANPDLTGAFNIGNKLAQVRQENDPSKQFVQGLMQRVQEDAKNKQAQSLFNAINKQTQSVNFGTEDQADYNYPRQTTLGQLFGGVQAPDLGILETVSTVGKNQSKSFLDQIKAQESIRKQQRMQDLAKQSESGDLIQRGVDSDGNPLYTSKKFMEFQRELVTENPMIDMDTQKAIAGATNAEPILQEATSFINQWKGSPKDFQRYVDEIKISGEGPNFNYLIEDGSPMESLVGNLRALRTLGFAVAGQNYTALEKQIIEEGTNPRGKSPEQFEKDVYRLFDQMVDKARAGTMGLKQAREKVSGLKKYRELNQNNNSDLLSAVAAEKARRKSNGSV